MFNVTVSISIAIVQSLAIISVGVVFIAMAADMTTCRGATAAVLASVLASAPTGKMRMVVHACG
eukprot:12436069-Alexandrium_andersonii.AAC.1